MNRITFSYNWNKKLDSNYYTTLRLSNVSYQKGQLIEIVLKGKKIHTGKIIEMRLITIDQINEFIGGLDTGYGAEETKNIIKKMYPNKNWEETLLVLILIRNEDWWKAHLEKMEKVVIEKNQNINHAIELE